MGKQSPDRVAAIRTELALMEPPAVDVDLLASCDDEDSRAIVETNEFEERVDRIYAENKHLGITPNAWFCALQWPSSEDCRVRDELTDRWQTEMEYEHDLADWPDHYYSGRTGYKPLTDQEMVDEKIAEDWFADRFDDPGNYWDEWSGPFLPMSAVQDL